MFTLTPPIYFDRDLSWLSFNDRILEEAANPGVPLYERIRFLAIFSSNLDEFSRVRMPALYARRIHDVSSEEAADTTRLEAVQDSVQRSLIEFGRVLNKLVLPSLALHNVHVYYNQSIPEQFHTAINDYFYSRVLAYIQPVWLNSESSKKPFLKDNALYFVVVLNDKVEPERVEHVLLNIPRNVLSRFLLLPGVDDQHAIVFLDDIIRLLLPVLFQGYYIDGCYSFKINRDADSSIENEEAGKIDRKVASMIALREKGLPSRFLYDEVMPAAVQTFLASYFLLSKQEMVKGGRYHNLRDLEQLPKPTKTSLTYSPSSPLTVPELQLANEPIFNSLDKKDYLLHFPYQSYNPILRFFNESAIDPYVTEIYVSLYRVAADSIIVSALINAARNGKQVVVFLELKARFDEENNLKWAKKMKKAGVKILYSIPGLKVHAKTALVKRKIGEEEQSYGLVSTGNFNESTARFYTDHILLTSHEGITHELEQLFKFLQRKEILPGVVTNPFQHLLVSQFNLMDRFIRMIDLEIENKRAGLPARIILKMNNLQERVMIDKLYEASQEGVQIELLIRGICCLVPGVPDLSDNIRVTRIVDKYLEHGRIFYFLNKGLPVVFIGSYDWMERNIYHRVEVCCPLYNADLVSELESIILLQLEDNKQARLVRSDLKMVSKPIATHQVRSQEEIYTMLVNQLNV